MRFSGSGTLDVAPVISEFGFLSIQRDECHFSIYCKVSSTSNMQVNVCKKVDLVTYLQ